MKLLRLAIKSERWCNSAAHTIVLEAAKQLEKGGKTDGKERKTKRRPAEGSERQEHMVFTRMR